jgi:hypothetical protein
MTDPTCAAFTLMPEWGLPPPEPSFPLPRGAAMDTTPRSALTLAAKIGNYGGISKHVSGFRPSALRRSNQYWFKPSRKE